MNRLAIVLGMSLAALPVLPLLARDAHHPVPAVSKPIAAAVAAPTRTPANLARDRYRHPGETLTFFGVTPTQTVVEYSPSGGWYTEILAPLLRAHGAFYALQPAGKGLETTKAFLSAKPETYDKVKLVAWPDAIAAIPPGSVDTVLTFRNVHNLIQAGSEATVFKAFFAVLKPGGILGVVDHRLPETRDSAQEKDSGYLKISTVRRIAEAAGFQLVGSSEVNANPKDSADWPQGVWTLPPTLRLGAVNRDTYLAVGESDRMTLKFRKPFKPAK